MTDLKIPKLTATRLRELGDDPDQQLDRGPEH
jgi:hypothetical protein